MTSDQARGRWSIVGADPRPAFAIPGMRQIGEIQRVVSYAAVLILVFVLDLPTISFAIAAALAIAGGGRAVWALRHPQHAGTVAASLFDIAIAPILVALGTGSPEFAFAAAAGIAGLTILAYDVPPLPVLVPAAAFGALGALVARWWPDATAAMDTTTIVVLAATVSATSLIGVVAAQTRKALLRKQTELGTVLESTPVVVLTIDEDGRLATVAGGTTNPSWQVGAPSGSSLPPALLQLIEAGRAHGRITGDVVVDGRDLEVTVRTSPTEVTVVGYDVTEHEAARRELERLIHDKDEFLATISHELRTPLTVVLGYAETLQECGTLERPEREQVDTMATQAHEMARIIEDLLVAARADLDVVAIETERVDLLSETQAVVHSVANKCTCTVSTEGEPSWALADPLRVRQILRNLVVNADRYGGDHVRLVVGVDHGEPTVEVRDDGPPIATEQQMAMFEAFETSGPQTGAPSAIGLGLHVSQRLAAMMNGTIDYEHDGTESIFRLRLEPGDTPIARAN